MIVEVGQKVISSGLGGIFPKGLLIGEVTEVSTDDYGLTKLAYIRPAADFSMLDHVIIAKRTSITELMVQMGTVLQDTEGEEDHDPIRHPSYCCSCYFSGACFQSVFAH